MSDDMLLVQPTKRSSESSDDKPLVQMKRSAVASTERRFDLDRMGLLKKLFQTTMDAAFTFLTCHNVRLISWSCRAIHHIVETTDFLHVRGVWHRKAVL